MASREAPPLVLLSTATPSSGSGIWKTVEPAPYPASTNACPPPTRRSTTSTPEMSAVA
jgi:hypothetical protein